MFNMQSKFKPSLPVPPLCQTRTLGLAYSQKVVVISRVESP